MWALDQPCALRADRFLVGTPLPLLAALAIGAATVAILVEAGVLPREAARVAGVTAGHGALLATALAWARVGPSSILVAVALLGLAAVASQLSPLGSLAYLGPALWVGRLSADGQLVSLGLGPPVSLRRWGATGVLVGRGPSGHLLVSASRALGVQVRVDHVSDVLVAIAYDVGANV